MNKTDVRPELQSVTKDTPIPDMLSIVGQDGGVIIRNLLTGDQVARLNAECDPHLAQLNPGSTRKAEEEQLDDFYGRNTKRLTNLVVLSETFRNEVLGDDKVLAIADGMLLPHADSYWMTTAQLIEIGPGNKAQTLHRELENYPFFKSTGPEGPEVILNILIALTDFTEEMGATRVIPGSNQWPDYTYRGEPEMTIPAVMNRGDALLINGKVLHGGGANVTADKYRRGIAFAFNLGWLVPEEAYPFLIPLELARTLDPRIQQLLGFRSFKNVKHEGGPVWGINNNELADYLKLD